MSFERQPIEISHRYRLLAPLRAGGMGVVYRAYDRLTQQQVALKQVVIAPENLIFNSRAELSDPTGLLLALAQEFRILASLRHPHIISVLDYGFDTKRRPFFTMELLEASQTLLQAGREQPLSVQVDLLIQMLQALAYLHRRGILHRDLKPENTLVSHSRVRVLDFGLSLTYEQARRATSSGTILYMAPETLAGKPATPASDLYAVGIIAYEMLVGHHPFYRIDIDTFIEQLLHAEADIRPLAHNLALAGVLGKLLMRQPEARYQQANAVIADLCAAVGREVPAESVAIRESFLQAATFVGREDEFFGLTIALEAARRGHGSAWLVGGESGVGKSRLLDELRTHALVAGALVLRGQAVEGGGLPYQLWREPLRRLVLSSDLSDLEASVLKLIIPDIANLLERPIPDAPHLEGQAAQQRLHLTIVDLLKRHQRPVVLLLEDLQWTSESLVPLRALLRLVKELSLLIVGSYRDDERQQLPTELPEARVTKLDRLSQAAITELSAAMLGEVGQQPQIIEFIQRETEGNTFFMVEVVRALAEEAGRLSDIGRITLPQRILAGGMQAVLRRRLARVPVWAQPVLKVAAIAGRHLDRQVITAAHPDCDWESWLTACSNASLLDVTDGQWRFAHDKLRETLLADLAPAERPLLHRQVAQVLEAIYPNDVTYAETLADHWTNAGEPHQAMPYLVQAARHLVYITADYARAEQLIARGLAASNSTNRATWLHLWGDNRSNLGDFNAAAAHYTACLQASAADPILQATVYNGLSTMRWEQGNFQEAQTYAQQALGIARALDDQSNIAESLYNLGWSAFFQGNYPLATTYLEESLAIRQARQDQYSTAWIFSGLGVIAYQRGQYTLARHYVEANFRISQEIGHRLGIVAAQIHMGHILNAQGEYPESRRCHQESLALFKTMGNQDGVAVSLHNIGVTYLNEGDYNTARTYLTESLQLDQLGNNQMGIARSHRNLGRVDYIFGQDSAALAHFDECLRIRRIMGNRPGIVAVQADRVLLLLRMDDCAAAQSALVEALQIASELAAPPRHARALLAAAHFAHHQGQFWDAGVWVGLLARERLLDGHASRILQTLAQTLEKDLGNKQYVMALAGGNTLDLLTAVQVALKIVQ